MFKPNQKRTFILTVLLFILAVLATGCDVSSNSNNNNSSTNGGGSNSGNTRGNNPGDNTADVPDYTNETFDDADKPMVADSTFEGMGYSFLIPWNYNKDHNQNRSYPIIIDLHTSALPNFLGNDEGNANEEKSTNFKKTYPCFVIKPHGWNINTIIKLAEDVKSKYRVDTKRVYLIGYSRGGSAVLQLAKAYGDYHNQQIAGIIRMAGMTGVNKAEIKKYFSNTAFWLHIGESDAPNIVNTTVNLFADLEDFHQYPSKSVKNIVLHNRWGSPGKIDIQTEVTSLSKNGHAVVKKSTYKNDVGHGISHIPFLDTELLPWLFEQRLP